MNYYDERIEQNRTDSRIRRRQNKLKNTQLKVIDMYTISCTNNHIFKVRNFTEFHRNPKCPICELVQNEYLFNTLSQINAKCIITEQFDSEYIQSGIKLRQIAKYNIEIFSNITGRCVYKIVFQDVKGDKEEDASNRSIHFKLFDLNKLENKIYIDMIVLSIERALYREEKYENVSNS